MERSVIRDQPVLRDDLRDDWPTIEKVARPIPDYASLHPGYGKREPFGGDSALSC
jgi:hypothetical protein